MISPHLNNLVSNNRTPRLQTAPRSRSATTEQCIPQVATSPLSDFFVDGNSAGKVLSGSRYVNLSVPSRVATSYCMKRLKAHVNSLLGELGYRVVRKRPDILDVLRSREVDLVLDVGANVGQFASSLRRRGYRGEIASFEPVPELCARLRKFAASDSRWRVFEIALGEYDGDGQLSVAQDSELSSLLAPTKGNLQREPKVAEMRSQRVLIRRLDSIYPELGAQRPFLKIDVQGTEDRVLKGASESISKLVGVQLEIALYEFYQGQLLIDEALTLMRDLGFVPALIDPIGYYDAADPCRLMETDWVFVRPIDCNVPTA
jgi:FkbM family methyltransferase